MILVTQKYIEPTYNKVLQYTKAIRYDNTTDTTFFGFIVIRGKFRFFKFDLKYPVNILENPYPPIKYKYIETHSGRLKVQVL